MLLNIKKDPVQKVKDAQNGKHCSSAGCLQSASYTSNGLATVLYLSAPHTVPAALGQYPKWPLLIPSARQLFSTVAPNCLKLYTCTLATPDVGVEDLNPDPHGYIGHTLISPAQSLFHSEHWLGSQLSYKLTASTQCLSPGRPPQLRQIQHWLGCSVMGNSTHLEII